ncbi:MAG: IS66 family insertion sequence element accessory protein TnpA, partial [Terriglobales bacterium]
GPCRWVMFPAVHTTRETEMADEQHAAHTPEEWRQLIDEQRGSGQSQDAFCAAHGLAKSTFQSWKRCVYGRAPARAVVATATRPSHPVGAALFTPLARPMAGQASPAMSTTGWTVELELGDGLCLRLRQGS